MELEKLNGHGIYEWPDGHVYIGYWVNGQRHGCGVHKWPEGEIYDGEWDKDNRHGHGVQKWMDGRTYDGEWVDSYRHGKGVLALPNGCVCECIWENDTQISGVATWPDGRTYKGTWVNGNVSVGILEYPDGDVFHVDTETGIFVLDGDAYAMPNMSIYHTFKEPVSGLGAYDEPIWKRFQLEMGLDNIYDLVSHFFDLKQIPDKMVRFFEQVVPHDIAVSCTDFMVERWGEHTIPSGMNRYVYLEQFSKHKPTPLVHTHSVTFDNGTSCSYQMKQLNRIPNTLTCFDEHQHKCDWSCSICMSNLPETHNIKRSWLICGHSFHNSCIFEWFSKNKSCPMCRTKTTYVSFTPSSIL